jgi:molybdopterin converting factor small subunit
LRSIIAYASPFRESLAMREETYETEGDSVAVNARLAKLSDHVHDGDRVSILLPVAGGSEE